MVELQFLSKDGKHFLNFFPNFIILIISLGDDIPLMVEKMKSEGV